MSSVDEHDTPQLRDDATFKNHKNNTILTKSSSSTYTSNSKEEYTKTNTTKFEQRLKTNTNQNNTSQIVKGKSA